MEKSNNSINLTEEEAKGLKIAANVVVDLLDIIRKENAIKCVTSDKRKFNDGQLFDMLGILDSMSKYRTTIVSE